MNMAVPALNDSASTMQEEPLSGRTDPALVDFGGGTGKGLPGPVCLPAFTDSITRVSQVVEAFEADWIGIKSFTPPLPDIPMGGVKEVVSPTTVGPRDWTHFQTRFPATPSSDVFLSEE